MVHYTEYFETDQAGAIMFNDPLSHSECEDLLRRLAKCAFPFQCAHGRPSMAPLLDLGQLVSKTEDMEVGGSLAPKLKAWKGD